MRIDKKYKFNHSFILSLKVYLANIYFFYSTNINFSKIRFFNHNANFETPSTNSLRVYLHVAYGYVHTHTYMYIAI